eukprot:CAMPEP_0203898260 /NCGR_PEP_ID=MMETSP0359-20131031/40817_1 /ASSEMBLY_ACC=CAM_ASM_000338 /TAXON_ID=268821 /ORGANISM="Scrippsiella Hangoei, Strain SHTV-5" /LENGTH=83 /DNA_ID=CAMNT_0050821305 /DNA_START=47 /DNA_END=299 /DNA_ORIENTATION=-
MAPSASSNPLPYFAASGASALTFFPLWKEEMFKTEEKMLPCMARMSKETGFMWLFRGINKNWIAVAAPIASTIFLTDRFKTMM